MMRATFLGVVLAMGAVGCGSAGTGSAGEYLVSGLDTREDLYVAPGVDTRPLTLAQLGEENADRAIAVDVEIYDTVAVAWTRDAAGNPIYSRDAIVGMWRVIERDVAYATPTDGELNPPDDGGPVYVPGGSVGTVLQEGFANPGPTNEGEGFDLVDFSDLIDTAVLEDARVWGELNSAHPGCA